MASSFCTADGRVIDAIGGPVLASQLLEDAKWAVNIGQQLEDQNSQVKFVQQAHLLELDKLNQSERALRRPPQVTEDQSVSVEEIQHLTYRRSQRIRYILKSKRAHQIFSEQPLANISEIGRRIFQKLAGQQYVDNRDRVEKAAEGIEKAKNESRPLVLVFFSDGHIFPSQRNPQADIVPYIMKKLSQPSRRMKNDLAEAVVVAIPIDERPALSQLVNLPIYKTEGRSLTVAIANPDGSEVVSQGGQNIDFNALSDKLFLASREASLQRAKILYADGKEPEAMKLLKRELKYTKLPRHLAVSINSQLEDWQ